MVYKYVANTNAPAHRQKMMNTQMKLNLEDEVREFVGDFNKLFKDLEGWTNNAIQIETWKDHFLKEYPKIFPLWCQYPFQLHSSENEVEMDIDTTTETKPAIDKEKKLQKVREKLLSKRTDERFTDYDGVMFDPNLTRTQKIIYFQKGIQDQQEERFTKLHYKENYLKNAFINRRKFMKKFWWKRRLQDGGRNFYENYTNLLWTTIKLTTALFL